MNRSVHTSLLACALLAAQPAALAQADGAYVPPKGGYDTPGSFIKPLAAVGETYERTLGTALTNVYQRQVRLKVLGLEDMSRLSTLKQQIDQGADAEAQRQAAAPARKTSLLGSLFNQANAAMSQEVERQKEVAKDELVLRLVEGGSPADAPSAVLVDMMQVPDQVTGSFLGAKINKDVRVSVVSDDFKPRLMVVRYRPKGAMTPLQGDASPEFSVVAASEQEGDDALKIFATFDRSKASLEGRSILYIVVTSADGKATEGKYKIRYYPQP